MPLDDIRPDQEGEVVLHNGTNFVRGDGTAVAAPAPSGNTHTVAAGATTSVFTNTTFDGGTGSTAYTVGDIVAALKSVKIIPS